MKKFKLKKDKGYFQSLRETKSVQELENGAVEISGYASTKDKDRGGDVVEPKAFASALERYMTNPIVLLQHKADKPIGIVEEANIDDNGLFIKANISQNTDGVIDLIKNGVLRAFSIGYSVKDYDTDVRELADGSYDMTNIIKDLELYEISVVSVPMNPYALSKSVEDLLEVEDHEDEDLSEEETSEEVEETVEEKPAEVEEEKKEESEEVETEEIVEEGNDKRDQEYVAEETADGVAVEVKEAEAENLDEKDGELDENLDEKEEEVAEEPKEADENSEIEEAEIEESSENAVETQADEMKVDETSDGQVVETKSIEADSQKQLDFDSKIEKLSKSFEEKLSRKDEEIKSLTSKVETMTKLFAESLDTIENLMTAVKNTPVNSGLAYKKPLKKGYSSIAEGIKNFYNS